MTWFSALVLAGWAAVVLTARLLRGRQFATFSGVILGIYSLLAIAQAPAFPALRPLLGALAVAVVVNFLGLARPRMRPFAYRLLVSWPAAFFVGGTLLGLPWGVAAAFGLRLPVPWLPYALAAVGLVQSLTTKREEIDLALEADAALDPLRVVPHPWGAGRVARPLRIVQISDPHLGPFMSVERLRRIAERAVAAEPDLVLLTGDFLTMESQTGPDLLRDALAPLAPLAGRTFACHGNHDHESPEIVGAALAANGITLLVDQARSVATPAGRVQILGVDFRWRDRAAHLAEVCQRHPRVPGELRVVILHDPMAFRDLPAGEGDLVLSGHTHGGQVGLLSLGLSWTFLRFFGERIPDHGFWARGGDRMWIHRGTGHYGFPLRLGVPAEESVLRVHGVGTVPS